MKILKYALQLGLLCSFFIITACSPEIGSEAWCENMNEKPKGDWTVNEASEYAKNCFFKIED